MNKTRFSNKARKSKIKKLRAAGLNEGTTVCVQNWPLFGTHLVHSAVDILSFPVLIKRIIS